MRAIVYTSNTGSTAGYAALLGKETGLPVFPLKRAKKELPAGTEIIYLGWVMASGVKGYKEASRRFRVRAVCAVGMCRTGTQDDIVREKNAFPADTPLFTLQGNFDVGKLRGVYKLMMGIMVKTAGKALAEKADRTPEEDDLLDMMLHGGERVSRENLDAVLEWYGRQ